jgi:glycosyltransferase involved in cell wall biosynthesis
VRFTKFDGADFGKKIVNWLDEPAESWRLRARDSASRVKAELDWQTLCQKAIDFVEKIYHEARG